MPVIDPDGLFYGDRLAKLTLMARLYYPYIYAAANHYGRLEINYHRIVIRAFARFPQVPTEEEFNSYILEYNRAYLLFLYEANNQIWGQFDTSEKYLPHYKNAESRRSPKPDESFVRWKEEYARIKESAIKANPFVAFVRGTQGVEGSAWAAKLLAPTATPEPDTEAAPVLVLTPSETEDEKKARKKQFLDDSHAAFYAEYWLKVGKKKSRDAWPKAIVRLTKSRNMTATEAAEFLVSKVREVKRLAMGRADLAYVLKTHPASWLNGEKWDDEYAPAKAMGTTASGKTFEQLCEEACNSDE